MVEKTVRRITTLNHVYLIIAIFVALIIILITLIQLQMNALMGVRAFVGAEGLWAKAQKDATRSIEHFALTHNEDDFKSYLQYMKVPLGDYAARIELQKPNPNLDIARGGFLNGGNHPEDIEYMINLFIRFEHFSFMSDAISHWTLADQLIEELNGEAKRIHEGIAAGYENRNTLGALLGKLDLINQRLTEQENLFSSTLASASRLASEVSRIITYSLAFLFTLLAMSVSWVIVARIRATETALFKSEETLLSILNVSPIAVRIAVNSGREVVFYNRSYSELIENVEATGDDPKRYYARPADYEEILEELANGKSVINRQIELSIYGGSTIWTLASYMPMMYLGQEAILGWFFDISHIKKHEAELRRVAHYDLLTGIPNRVLLADRMHQAIAQHVARKKYDGGLLS
jgi:PAS domain-containing protein